MSSSVEPNPAAPPAQGQGQGQAPEEAGHPERWEQRWLAGQTKWDQGAAHPALVRLLLGDAAEGKERAQGQGQGKGDELGIKREGRALVPGCGMGYDVLLLAQRGLDAVGLDLAPTGVAAAQAYLAAQTTPESPLAPLASRVTVQQADFFKYDPGPGMGYDVILDYTFLCALPPPLRPDWRDTLARLAKPARTTRLITLMFPLFPEPKPKPEPESGVTPALPDGGPPFALTEGVYHDLLDARWELLWSEDLGKVRTTGPKGGERVGVWAWRGE